MTEKRLARAHTHTPGGRAKQSSQKASPALSLLHIHYIPAFRELSVYNRVTTVPMCGGFLRERNPTYWNNVKPACFFFLIRFSSRKKKKKAKKKEIKKLSLAQYIYIYIIFIQC